MPVLLLIFVFAALTGLAQAQEKEDLTLTLSPEDHIVGIDTCASDVDKSITLSGELESADSYEGYELRITYGLAGTRCNRDTLPSCPSSDVDSECGCLSESATETVSKTQVLSDMLSSMGDLCARTANVEHSIRFYLEYYLDEDGEDNDKDIYSEPLTIKLDFKRPSTPSSAPTVEAAEGALEINIEALSDDDIDEYQICIKAMGGAEPAAADAGVSDGGVEEERSTNESLKEGFSTCRTIAGTVTSYRFEGLANNTTYAAVYAGVDNAGNRGPNSPSAMGTPSEVDDFAEVYGQMNGSETGGCALSTRGQSPALLLAALPLLALLLRRRS